MTLSSSISHILTFRWQQRSPGTSLAEYLEKKFGDVWHCLNMSSHIILESGCDNDYKRHHGSHVTNPAISELGDLHRQAVPQRFFPAAENKMKPTCAEHERGGIFVFQQR